MKRNRIVQLLFLSSCFFMLTSCKLSNLGLYQAQARMIESDFDVVTAPVIGELGTISPISVTDSMEFAVNLSSQVAYSNVVKALPDYKSAALSKCCVKNGYDLIINPLFVISTNEEGNKIKVVFTGYPAKYKSFRPATKDDTWMHQFFNRADDTKSEQVLNK